MPDDNYPRNRIFSILSWSFYDFANTIFSMNVITLYFALWVTVDKGGEDILYSLSLASSIFFCALLAPILGVISDRINRRKPFLIFFTILCALFTSFIGIVDRLFLGLLFFAIANFGYQMGGVFYDTLLPRISSKKDIGRISGYGVATGYIGTLAGLMLVKPFVDAGGRQAAFVPTAVLFILFALPCLIFVKDKMLKINLHPAPQETTGINPWRNGEESPKGNNLDATAVKPWCGVQGVSGQVKEAFVKICNTLKIRGGILNIFLLASFFCMIPINTLLVFVSVYAKKVFSFSDKDLFLFFIISTIFAISGALTSGFLTDRFGARKTLLMVLSLWSFILFLGMVIPQKDLFWAIGPLSGICLGGTWVSARVILVELAPVNRIGEFFGLCALVGRASSIIGPLLWGILVWTFGFTGSFKYRLAVFMLLIFMLIGLTIFYKRVYNADLCQKM